MSFVCLLPIVNTKYVFLSFFWFFIFYIAQNKQFINYYLIDFSNYITALTVNFIFSEYTKFSIFE